MNDAPILIHVWTTFCMQRPSWKDHCTFRTGDKHCNAIDNYVQLCLTCSFYQMRERYWYKSFPSSHWIINYVVKHWANVCDFSRCSLIIRKIGDRLMPSAEIPRTEHHYCETVFYEFRRKFFLFLLCVPPLIWRLYAEFMVWFLMIPIFNGADMQRSRGQVMGDVSSGMTPSIKAGISQLMYYLL